MVDLYAMALSVKGATGVLSVLDGRVSITKKSNGATWSASLDEVVGYRSKKPGLGSGFLSFETLGGPPPANGLMNAMTHPQTIVLQTYGQWRKVESLIAGLDQHSPAGSRGQVDALAKVRTAKTKFMKQFDGLAAHLEPDEVVDAAVFGVYETELLGSDTVRNGVLAATDRRVVFFAKKMAGYDLESFSYDKLSSLEISKGMMGEKYTFFASGNKVELKWVSERFGEDFASTVRQRMNSRSAPDRVALPPPGASAVPTGRSVADQIRDLGALMQEGLLTADEFAAEKAKLLRRTD